MYLHKWHLNDNIKAIAGVKKFLDNATQQVQAADDLNAEVVSEGEPYIEMVHHTMISSFTLSSNFLDIRVDTIRGRGLQWWT